MVWVPSGVTSTTAVVAGVGDEDVAAPSTATPRGSLSPEPTVVWVPSGFTSTTWLLLVSAMKTSPAAVHRHARG